MIFFWTIPYWSRCRPLTFGMYWDYLYFDHSQSRLENLENLYTLTVVVVGGGLLNDVKHICSFLQTTLWGTAARKGDSLVRRLAALMFAAGNVRWKFIWTSTQRNGHSCATGLIAGKVLETKARCAPTTTRCIWNWRNSNATSRAAACRSRVLRAATATAAMQNYTRSSSVGSASGISTCVWTTLMYRKRRSCQKGKAFKSRRTTKWSKTSFQKKNKFQAQVPTMTSSIWTTRKWQIPWEWCLWIARACSHVLPPTTFCTKIYSPMLLWKRWVTICTGWIMGLVELVATVSSFHPGPLWSRRIHTKLANLVHLQFKKIIWLIRIMACTNRSLNEHKFK